ncbi:hypothetical protein MCOR02_001369 [Pyricularia oryzae]|nr:hypothetical protein MCOR02_001369 [Pyricularia oryzae]
MGLLTTNEVIECSVSDFIGKYLGETAPKLRALLDRALGKVLFIDEAYRLATGKVGRKTGRSFEEDAVAELVDSLTKERYRRRWWSSWSVHQVLGAADWSDGRCDPRQGGPGPQAEGKVLRVMGKLIATRDWSNGRDIETLAAEMVGEVYCREGRRGQKSARLQVSTEELLGFLLDMLKRRRAGELVDEE